jgi:hypothetical protein
MAKYIVKSKTSKEYYIGHRHDYNWGQINNAKKFNVIPYTDNTCVILEIKPDGKLVEVRR